MAGNLLANLRKPFFESLDLLVHVLSTQAGERPSASAAGQEMPMKLWERLTETFIIYKR